MATLETEPRQPRGAVAPPPRRRGDIGDFALVGRFYGHQPRAVVNFAAEDRVVQHPRPGRLHSDQHRRRLPPARSGACLLGGLAEPARARFRFTASRRRVWQTARPGRSAFRETSLCEPERSVLGKQGRQRSPGSRLCHPRLRRGPDLVANSCGLPLGKAYPAGHPTTPWPGKPLPLYGDGQQILTGSAFKDHCSLLTRVVKLAAWARPTTSAAGTKSPTSTSLQRPLCHSRRTAAAGPMASPTGTDHLRQDRPQSRPYRYAIEAPAKIERELGWKPANRRDRHPTRQIRWYLDNQAWVANVTSGATNGGWANNTEKTLSNAEGSSRRWAPAPPVSRSPWPCQTIVADPRQTDDLLPADHADAGRHPGHPDHLDACRTRRASSNCSAMAANGA